MCSYLPSCLRYSWPMKTSSMSWTSKDRWLSPARSFLTQKNTWWSTYSRPRSQRLKDPMMLSLLPAPVDVVRAADAEVLAEPLRRLLHVGDGHDPVADPLHSRAAFGQPHQRARPLQRVLAEIEGLAPHGDGGKPLDPVDHLDLVAVRLSQPDALAAAGLVDGLDGRGPGRLGQLLEVVEAGRVVGEAHELGITLFRDVDVMSGIRPSHVERVRRPLRLHHAEMGQELLRHVEIGCAQPSVRQIGDLDQCHGLLHCLPAWLFIWFVPSGLSGAHPRVRTASS